MRSCSPLKRRIGICSSRDGRRVTAGAEFRARKAPLTLPEHSVQPDFFLLVSMLRARTTSSRYVSRIKRVDYPEIRCYIGEVRRPIHSAGRICIPKTHIIHIIAALYCIPVSQ
jgi:hypothetical protein